MRHQHHVIIYLLVILCTCHTISTAQIEYTIRGELAAKSSSVVYLAKKDVVVSAMENVSLAHDSSEIKDGQYSMSGTIPEVDEYCLFLNDVRGWRTLILANSHYEISGSEDSFWRAKINSDFEEESLRAEFNQSLATIITKLNASSDSAGVARKSGDQEKVQFFRNINRMMSDSMENYISSFIQLHPKNYTSLFAFSRLLSTTSNLTLDSKQALYELFPDSLKNHSRGREYYYELYELEANTDLGSKAIQFSLPNQKGQVVSSESFPDKYILLEFWASWCAPCRVRNKQMISVYLENRDILEIIGISLDTDRVKWIKAIKEDQLPWQNLSDLKGSAAGVVKNYGVKVLPTNFLLNQEGLIVGKNLNPLELNKYFQDIKTKK